MRGVASAPSSCSNSSVARQWRYALPLGAARLLVSVALKFASIYWCQSNITNLALFDADRAVSWTESPGCSFLSLDWSGNKLQGLKLRLLTSCQICSLKSSSIVPKPFLLFPTVNGEIYYFCVEIDTMELYLRQAIIISGAFVSRAKLTISGSSVLYSSSFFATSSAVISPFYLSLSLVNEPFHNDIRSTGGYYN